MSELTLPELIEIMRECAGEDEAVDLGGADIGDVALDELGYDSLALMEAASRIKRQFTIELPEEKLTEIRTLNQFLTLVNEWRDPTGDGRAGRQNGVGEGSDPARDVLS